MTFSSIEKHLRTKQRGWRRRHQRYRADFPVKATLLQEHGYADILGRCADIGRGGMGAVLTAELPKGEVVSLEFSLNPNVPVLTVRSIVRYRRGFVHGLEFMGLSAEQNGAIDAFCAGLGPTS